MKAKLLPECPKCGEANPEKFAKSSTTKSGYQSWCRACTNEWQRENRAQRDSEKRRKYHQKWRMKNHEQYKQTQNASAKRIRRKAAEYEGLVKLLRDGEIEKAVKMARMAKV